MNLPRTLPLKGGARQLFQNERRQEVVSSLKCEARPGESWRGVRASNLTLPTENLSAERPIYELPGDLTHGETPVPIPNTEAKPVAADGSRFAARVGDCQEL
jgi:hypothetical protein